MYSQSGTLTKEWKTCGNSIYNGREKKGFIAAKQLPKAITTLLPVTIKTVRTGGRIAKLKITLTLILKRRGAQLQDDLLVVNIYQKQVQSLCPTLQPKNGTPAVIVYLM